MPKKGTTTTKKNFLPPSKSTVKKTLSSSLKKIPASKKSSRSKQISSYQKFITEFAAAVTVLRIFAILMISIGTLVYFAAPKTTELKLTSSDHTAQLFPQSLASPISTVSGEVSSATDPSQVPTSVHVPILYYHYIEINPDPVGDPGRNELLITPENFEDQLLSLKDHGYTTINLDDLVRGINDPSTLPDKPIILTVDDGYRDFYTNAFPIIKKVGLKLTLFALARSDQMGSNYLSNSQLKEISQSPLVTIACHTLDHTDLKNRDENFQRDQIFGCKSQMESIIGKPVRHFAYPYGDFDETTLRLVQEAGYETASSTIGGSYQGVDNIFQLRRIHVGNYGGTYLESVLEGFP